MLGKRVKATFKHSIIDYLSFLDKHPNDPEWTEVEQILTIQKTEFFRESSQMKFFEETILPEIKHRKFRERDSKVRAWSCGCSTGEEAYTLSILFHQRFLPSTEWDVRILASDVHLNALEFGQNAEYKEESLQNVSKENKLSYFEKIGHSRCDASRFLSLHHPHTVATARWVVEHHRSRPQACSDHRRRQCSASQPSGRRRPFCVCHISRR